MSSEELSYGREIVRALKSVDPTSRVAIIIRHSIRGPIGEGDEDVPITEEGRHCAKLLGERLAWKGPLIARSSPKLRCVQTAEEVLKGYRSKNPDIETSFQGFNQSLAAMLHSDEFRPEISELIDEIQKAAYNQSSKEWNISPNLVEASKTISNAVLERLLDILKKSPEGTLNLFVDHDLHIILLRENTHGGRFINKRWLDFLDGIVLTSEDGGSISAVR